MISTLADDPTLDLILAEEERLRRFARHLSHCDADADDLVQDTLLRAFRARGRFVPDTSVAAWTGTILHRLFLTSLKRTKRRRVETDTDAGDPLGSALARRPDMPAPSSLAAFFERLDDTVKRALEHMPDHYREPFLLSILEDLTCSEIAERLRLPQGTVMSRIHRARERLKEELVYGRSDALVERSRACLR